MKTKLLAAAVAILLISLTIQAFRLGKEQDAHASTKIGFEAYKASQAAYNEARELEWINEIQEVRHEAQQHAEQIKRDNEAAHTLALNDTNSMYEQQIARLRASCNTTATTGSQDAPDPIGVLAHVLTRTDEAAGTYARVADERGVALNACIRAYEALRK